MMESGKKNKIFPNIWKNVLILIIFALLCISSLGLIRIKLMQNAKELGTYLTWNYSAEEQNNITIYETLIDLGTQYIDEQVAAGMSEDEIQSWISSLFKNISKMLGDQVIDLYVIVGDEIIAANPWEGIEDYNFQETKWYQDAMQEDGKSIFTDIYPDSITNKLVVTIAQKGKKSNSVLVFDVFLENFHRYQNPTSLPEGASYFLCDRLGNPLYYKTDLEQPYTELQKYLQNILNEIDTDSTGAYDITVQDPNGEVQGVYYYRMSNDWISVLTIPMDTILHGLNQFIFFFSVIFMILTIIVCLMAVRDYRLNQKIERVNNTVQVLGNSYYAIYRVNYHDGIYQEIKSAADIGAQISKTGDYQMLLNIIGSVVDENVYQEFSDSFSIENIRQLVANHVSDFGGDYLRTFQDTKKWVNVRLLFDDNLLDPGEVVLCFQEVDQEKKQQLKQMQLLQDALEAAQKSEKAKSIFFNSMSHDMRTPLNAILGLSELVQNHLQEPDKMKGYLEKIQFAGNQLLNLINDLLEISRLERGKVSLAYREIDLVECIKNCTDIFQKLAEKENKNLDVIFDVQDTVVRADAFRIGQILNNLISNAFKYSDAGASVTVRVKQCVYQQHSKYQIAVEDTGIGISEEFLSRIFECYARETRFSSKNIVGTGLGMPIVQRIVRQMSGEITVESTLGKGSTFTVTLPLETVTQEKNNQNTEVLAPKTFDLQGKRILLAEDNEINMEIAKEILSMNGVIVAQAWNGREAVEIFSHAEPFAFDAILMDMLMPEMGGCDATRAIRAMERPDAKSIPIIAVTANAFAEDIAMTTEAGMNAHISKPIDFTILCNTLQTMLS